MASSENPPGRRSQSSVSRLEEGREVSTDNEVHSHQQMTPQQLAIHCRLLLLAVLSICLYIAASSDLGDRIYSHRDVRRLSEASSDSSFNKLRLDERYAFDGTHSDFAQQFYRRYLAGDSADSITDTSGLTEVINYVKDDFGLEFGNLPAMLQQAVVWDMGYVAAADLGFVKVYTKCGLRMSELQISLKAFTSTGCTQQRCSSPNGDIFSQSLYCSGYQIGNESLCASTNGITPVHGSMWSDGGTDDVVPISEMQKHEWTDANISYTIMAIHLSDDINSYGKCMMPSMIVPCVAYDEYSSDDWCSPEHGNIVPQWLEMEKNGGVLVKESSETWHKAALAVTITSLVLLIVALVVAFVLWRKTQQKQHETEDLREQKREILGSRRSDGFSMMDDVDFILEAPGPSFIESTKGTPTQNWVAWNHTPVKPKLTTKPSDSNESEDLDAMALQAAYGDIMEADQIYLHDNLRHLTQSQSIRSPSKATTAALTSFNSEASGSPRNTLTLTFSKQNESSDPATDSAASTDPSSGTMVSPLVQFQSDPAVTSRRVPFVDVTLVRQLSTGAYGEVWVGRMRGEIVAVKRLLRDRRRQMRELEDFATEIQLMASFSHPNVLGLLGVAWTTLEKIYLLMEYMERGDLQHVLQHYSRRTQHDEDSIDEFSWASHKAKIARDIARGLEYLHNRKPTVVHRDLKSKNVLIGDNYEAKLSDFGVSRMRRDEETMTSGVGTAYWTAPEVLAGHKYSERADVYSLGVVLAELDTGELPFYDARTSDGDKMEAIHILHLVVSGELQPSFTVECPEDVKKLALDCMNPKPEDRPTAEEIVNELNRLLESDASSGAMTIAEIGGFV